MGILLDLLSINSRLNQMAQIEIRQGPLFFRTQCDLIFYIDNGRGDRPMVKSELIQAPCSFWSSSLFISINACVKFHLFKLHCNHLWWEQTLMSSHRLLLSIIALENMFAFIFRDWMERFKPVVDIYFLYIRFSGNIFESPESHLETFSINNLVFCLICCQ